ncbi:hypothetical protein [Brachyspira hampsonii]|uniref:Serpentine_recp domain containing protein n=1 Tax=Brachyspira hampsonii 30446 TaxID=1289135 RepID=A0A2U4EXQ0_9SPIR|nr:hypothetical protein [Brachyspira hampsonii]EKV58056.1 hypothetical protein A966_02013 [Brachyspira hampsonii 30446]MBW5389572.1 hypothetical protein [Brachyspira hampsonii]MBW5395406.1 hypothetical protein [Brachyspira hampsonii]OEJ16750.1 hypothetical protein A9495_08650 [Brachyspira hampsonii]
MKKLNYILFIITLILSINMRVFAENGFVAILNVPVGLSVGIPVNVNSGETLNKIGINTGVNAKLGYIFDLEKFGITPLLELGYSYDTYAYSAFFENTLDTTRTRITLSETINAHSFQIGIIPKINIENFAIGLGFGVKIPLYLTFTYNIVMFNNNNEYSENQNLNLDRKAIENRYSRSVIPYLKLSFDYYFAIMEKLAIGVGVYLGYDFGFPSRVYAEERLDSFNIAAQIGLRFGPGIEKVELSKIRYGF